MSPRSQGGPTIHDVARLAGVGSATVSRVINHDPKVRPATRERVMEAIRTLNYAPNPAAQQLAGSRLLKIGLVLGNPSRSFTYQLMRGALEEAARAGCQLVVGETAEEFLPAEVNGLVLGPLQYGVPEVRAALRASGLPIFVVNAPGPDPEFSTVSMDQRQGARDVAEHLLALGHRAFGFVNGDPRIRHCETRRRGFIDRLEEAGVRPADVLVEPGDFTFWSGFQAAERMLAGKKRPTAVFAANDDMAAGVVAAAHRLGLKVPGDLSIVGFDDAPIAAELWPPLTTVLQDTRAMVAAAIRALVERSQGGRDQTLDPIHLHWPHSLAIRESTAAP